MVGLIILGFSSWLDFWSASIRNSDLCSDCTASLFGIKNLQNHRKFLTGRKLSACLRAMYVLILHVVYIKVDNHIHVCVICSNYIVTYTSLALLSFHLFLELVFHWLLFVALILKNSGLIFIDKTWPTYSIFRVLKITDDTKCPSFLSFSWNGKYLVNVCRRVGYIDEALQVSFGLFSFYH